MCRGVLNLRPQQIGHRVTSKAGNPFVLFVFLRARGVIARAGISRRWLSPGQSGDSVGVPRYYVASHLRTCVRRNAGGVSRFVVGRHTFQPKTGAWHLSV
jgi:hypothetical protein